MSDARSAEARMSGEVPLNGDSGFNKAIRPATPARKCVAAAVAFYCGLRACEISLRWKHIDWAHKRLSVRRSKTPAGWRDPSLNQACLTALSELHQNAEALRYATQQEDRSNAAMTSWRSAWRSLRRAAGLPDVRFHDGRHTALTRLAEAGQPVWVIQAQIAHVSPR